MRDVGSTSAWEARREGAGLPIMNGVGSAS